MRPEKKVNVKKIPITTALLVWDYFDELINNLDIYTEESLRKVAKNEEQELRRPMHRHIAHFAVKIKGSKFSNSTKHHVDSYNWFESTLNDDTVRNEILATLPPQPTQIEYLNGIRAEAIKQIRKLRDQIIEKVKRSSTLSKCNPSQLTPQELEELHTQVFANSGFCFQIDLSKTNGFLFIYPKQIQNFQHLKRQFELITIFTDTYLSQDEITKLW
jgi:hypothetical protein